MKHNCINCSFHLSKMLVEMGMRIAIIQRAAAGQGERRGKKEGVGDKGRYWQRLNGLFYGHGKLF